MRHGCLIIGDLHYTSSRPRRRNDNFANAIRLKMDEISNIGANPDMIIQTGDLFQNCRPRWEDFRIVARWLSSFPKPVVVCPGNHDLEGGALASVRDLPLGVLEELGFIRTTSGFANGLEFTISQWGKPLGPGPGVLVAHEAIYPPDMDVPFQHYRADNLVALGWKVIIVGHVHIQARVERIGGTLFIWPGAISRGNILHDWGREPAVVWLDATTEPFEAEIVKLKTAAPFAEVFDTKQYEQEKQTEATFAEFVAGLRGAQLEAGFRDVFEGIRQLDSYKGLSDSVRDYIENTITEGLKSG